MGYKKARLATIEACDVIKELPKLYKYSKSPSLNKYDLLITAAGFEERAAAIPELIKNVNEFTCEATLVGTYRTNKTDNQNRYQSIKYILDSLSRNVFEVDADSPSEVLRQFKNLTSDWIGKKAILFDISGSSTSFIATIIGSIHNSYPDICLHVIYAEAKKYHEPKELESLPNEWTSEDMSEEGVSIVDINPLFSGAARDNTDDAVIFFPNMSPSRIARSLSHFIEEYERFAARHVTWVFPKTENEQHSWRAEKMKQTVSDILSISSESFENNISCDTHDYIGAVEALLVFSQDNFGKNLGSILMGSKLQTLGATLALCARPEIKNVYARPDKFDAQNYSKGIGKIWQLNIEDFKSLIHKLSLAGELKLILSNGEEINC